MTERGLFWLISNWNAHLGIKSGGFKNQIMSGHGTCMLVCMNDGRWSSGLSSCPSRLSPDTALDWKCPLGAHQLYHWSEPPTTTTTADLSWTTFEQENLFQITPRLLTWRRGGRVRGIRRLTLMLSPVCPRQCSPQTGSLVHIHKPKSPQRRLKRAGHM